VRDKPSPWLFRLISRRKWWARERSGSASDIDPHEHLVQFVAQIWTIAQAADGSISLDGTGAP
jgi:hypothetical protein